MVARAFAVVVLIGALVAIAWTALAGSDLAGSDPAGAELAGAELAGTGLAGNESAVSAELAGSDLAETGSAATKVDDDSSLNAAGESAGNESADSAAVVPESSPVAPVFPEPENFGSRLDLVDIDAWLQTDATSIDDFDGTVLMVEIWTFGCRNCKARIPHNQSYYEEFGDDNFEILGVHAPEFGHEADRGNIEQAIHQLGVTWPQALDTNKTNFRAWQPGSTSYWPRTFVIDQNGDIRYDHIGEGRYQELRETIRYLLEHPPESKT